MSVEFVVYGTPAPAGSKRGFIRGGRVIITDDSKHSRPWKALVSDAAAEAMKTNGVGRFADVDFARACLRGPLTLDATFYFPRPKGQMGTGRNAGRVKPGAPLYPAVKPDTTKLLRALEDACNGIVWKDDAQVVNQWVRKMYGEPARCEVRVQELDE